MKMKAELCLRLIVGGLLHPVAGAFRAAANCDVLALGVPTATYDGNLITLVRGAQATTCG